MSFEAAYKSKPYALVEVVESALVYYGTLWASGVVVIAAVKYIATDGE